MMGKFLHYEQCPRCMERGRDSRGDNFAVYSDSSGHCFSCSYHRFPKHHTPRMEKEQVNAAVLPIDFSREIPSHALQWLLQYELPYSYWSPFIGWSEEYSRLVFTVGTGPEFSIGRYIETSEHDRPAPRKWFSWGDCHKAPHILGDYLQSGKIVLVEDLISAHKVSKITSCIPLFGVRIFDSVIPCLRHIGLPVVLWLDKDQEGTLQKKCEWLGVLTGLKVSYIVTKLDPKCYSLDKIKEIL